MPYRIFKHGDCVDLSLQIKNFSTAACSESYSVTVLLHFRQLLFSIFTLHVLHAVYIVIPSSAVIVAVSSAGLCTPLTWLKVKDANIYNENNKIFKLLKTFHNKSWNTRPSENRLTSLCTIIRKSNDLQNFLNLCQLTSSLRLCDHLAFIANVTLAEF